MFKKVNLKRLLVAASAIAIIFIMYLWIKSCGSNVDVVYEYDNISRGDVKKTISVTGKLEVLDYHIVMSRISGIINNVFVDFNDNVVKNQLLASFDPVDVEQNILTMEREMERARLDVVEVKQFLDGKNELLKENLISKSELENAEIKYQKTLSLYKQKKLSYDIALGKRTDLRVTAPSSGIVISREINPQMPCPENKVLFVIARSLQDMKLMINVDESDIGDIKQGQKVDFTVSAYPERKFSGTINQVRINPVVSGAIVTYQSVVICENREQLLKPGMTATATILVNHKKDVLRIPNQAFIVSPKKVELEPGKKVLWRKIIALTKQIPVEMVEVKTGLIGDQYTEILPFNVSEGDSILVSIRKKQAVNDELSSYGK
jgi:HlyD family secretion protein